MLPIGAGAETGGNLPRYRLAVGQKIEYRESHKSEEQDRPGYQSSLACWVVGENPNRSHRLLFHFEYARVEVDEQGKESVRPIRDQYGYFDLFADGRIAPSKAFSSLHPETFFPRLPDAALTPGATWQAASTDGWTKYLFKADPPRRRRSDVVRS